MTKNEIGIHAALVWRLLNQKEKYTFDQLKLDSGLSNLDLSAALGWLACENKIEFENNSDQINIFLPVSFFF